MKVDRAEWEKTIKKLDDDVSNRRLALLEQAQVDKEKLTQDPKWDIFLQELQSDLNKHEKDLASYQEQLMEPSLVDPLLIDAIRHNIFITVARIGTLKDIMELPATIIAAAKGVRNG